ncbi:MAG: endonuclease/exonuclease/phosphatase family protein [Anaerolineales bacterium]|nr:endonuclease/exonuclease/phosphatase family protein [Anaerolineales bacterium]MCB9126696.1 endonuclease/exonuclease/phosphatase family protein [Ardenticatenales bacterium]MCB9171762.1 endonuclease/exonuclease/phosphatase family protein [Ardenticatenales bacterium]
MKSYLARILMGIAGLLTLLTLLGFLGTLYWLFDVMAYWRLQYAVLLLLLTIGLFLLNHRRVARWLLLPMLLNVVALAPFFLPDDPPVGEGPTLAVLGINIQAETEDMAPLAALLQDEQPDVVVVTEAQPKHLKGLQQQLPDLYPYVVDETQEGYFGILVLSKRPIAAQQNHQLGINGHLSVELLMEWQGKEITIYGVHLHPPLSEWGTEQRDSERADLAMIIGGIEEPQIVVGDFNATPWTYTMSGLTKAGELRHATRGFGVWPTWWMGSRLIGLPYDHILISPDFVSEAFALGPDVGSDHLPVIARIRFRDQAESR